jgi:hypothetical protein
MEISERFIELTWWSIENEYIASKMINRKSVFELTDNDRIFKFMSGPFMSVKNRSHIWRVYRIYTSTGYRQGLTPILCIVDEEEKIRQKMLQMYLLIKPYY